MLLKMRTKKTNELVVKDVLDVDFDMSIVRDKQSDNRYVVSYNRNYKSEESFLTQEEAEDLMTYIAEKRNALEQFLIDGYI